MDFVTTFRADPAAARRPPGVAIFNHQGARLVLDREVLAVGVFRPASAPANERTSETVSFGVPPGVPNTGYILHVINGDRRGKRRAAGVTIRINGVALTLAAKLTTSTEFLDIPIGTALKPTNELHVVVTGTAVADVTIVIQAAGSGR